MEKLRRENRRNLFQDEIKIKLDTPLVQATIKLIKQMNENSDDTFNLAEQIFNNIDKMNKGEINSISEYYPYLEVFSKIIIADYIEVQEYLFYTLCLMFQGIYCDYELFITPDILAYLFLFLDHPKFYSCSFYILSVLCQEYESLCQVFCMEGLLQKISEKPIDCIISQFVRLICLNLHIPDFQVQLCEIVIKMLQSESEIVVSDGLKSYLAIYINFKGESSQKVGDFLVSNFLRYVQFNSPDLISEYFNILGSMENLPVELIPYICQFLNHSSILVVKTASIVLISQSQFWSEKVDADLIYKALVPILEKSLPIDCERMIFTALLKYGNIDHLMMPLMISKIVKFAQFPASTADCLNAILKILSSSKKSASELFGDLTDDICTIASNEHLNGNEETALISYKILCLIDENQ